MIRKIRNVLGFIGAWTLPFMTIVHAMLIQLRNVIEGLESFTLSINWNIVIASCYLFPMAWITIDNFREYVFKGRRDFLIFHPRGYQQTKYLDDKVASMYRTPPEKFIAEKPEGLILGKINNKIVRLPIGFDENGKRHNIYNTLIVGKPGSGKSVLFMSTELAKQLNCADYSSFVLDIKGELHNNCTKIDDQNSRVIDPSNYEKTHGWDVYYEITHSSKLDVILLTMDKIARSIVVQALDPALRYFSDNATKCMKYMLAYYYIREEFVDEEGCVVNGANFCEALERIGSMNMLEHIKWILEDDVEVIEKNKKIKRGLMSLLTSDVGETEATSGIQSTMQTACEIFMNDEIRYILDCNNPNQTNPKDLNIGKNIYVTIDENKIDSYGPFLRVIMNQTLAELEKRELDTSRPVLFILDELVRIGSLGNRLITALSLLRGRGVYLVLSIQTLSQLNSTYGRDEAETIFNLCQVVVLLTGDTATLSLIKDLSPKYREVSTSIKVGGIFTPVSNEGTQSLNYHNVFDSSDIMQLSERGEIFVMMNGMQYILKKYLYFKDSKELNKLKVSNVQYNKQYLEKEGVKYED